MHTVALAVPTRFELVAFGGNRSPHHNPMHAGRLERPPSPLCSVVSVRTVKVRRLTRRVPGFADLDCSAHQLPTNNGHHAATLLTCGVDV
jgi:hypothetical protein